MQRKREGNLLGVPEEWEREVRMHMIKVRCLHVSNCHRINNKYFIFLKKEKSKETLPGYNT